MRPFTILISLVLTVPQLAWSKTHLVKNGDSISQIAKWYAVEKDDLRQANDLKKGAPLQPGQELIIPNVHLGNARRTHRIKTGDTLVKIARRYHVSQRALKTLNRLGPKPILQLGRTLAIPNKEGDPGPKRTVVKNGKKRAGKPTVSRHPRWAGNVRGLVESGKKVNGGVEHTVQYGQTLSMIANAYGVNRKQLARQNKITRKNPLRPGNTIFIKGAKRPVPVRTNKYRPHRVQFIKLKHTKKQKITLIKPNGVASPAAKRALNRLLGYKAVKPRLVQLLQRVAERFPGHAIVIISGYRKHNGKYKKTRSYHERNAAIDFRVQGVSNELLYEFVSAFSKVGAGYYPNSVHVHLDVRNKKYLWTDISGHGEKAQYVKATHPQHFSNVIY